MPTAQQILALVRSHVRGDDERFYSLVLQMAAAEAKRGHAVVAEQLKELLEQAKNPRPRVFSMSPIPVPAVSRNDLTSVLSVENPKTLLSNMVLDDKLSVQLSTHSFRAASTRATEESRIERAAEATAPTGPPVGENHDCQRPCW